MAQLRLFLLLDGLHLCAMWSWVPGRPVPYNSFCAMAEATNLAYINIVIPSLYLIFCLRSSSTNGVPFTQSGGDGGSCVWPILPGLKLLPGLLLRSLHFLLSIMCPCVCIQWVLLPRDWKLLRGCCCRFSQRSWRKLSLRMLAGFGLEKDKERK